MQLNNPLVKISVIIPTYNRASLLINSINSVINQTYKNIELIIIDDGSTDNTKKIVGNFIKKDSRIRYFYQENSGGPASPKNTGIRLAVGEYIAFLDDDDEWMPEKLEKQFKIFNDEKEEKPAMVSCDSIVVNDVNEKKVRPSQIKNFNFKDFLITNNIFTGTVLVKTSLIKEQFFDENLKFLEDWDMWISLLANNKMLKFYPEVLFKYKIRENNTTKKTNLLIKIDALKYVFNKHKYLYKKYSIIHKMLFKIGSKYLLAKEYRQAKQYFKLSIADNHWYLPSYLGYLVSFLGKILYPLFYLSLKIYRLINKKNWGNNLN